MRVIDKTIAVKKRSVPIHIYIIGDVHYGSSLCNEKALSKYIDRIKSTDNAYWIGGGDLCEYITPNDIKRWDVTGLPDSLFQGSPVDVKARLSDVIKWQIDGMVDKLYPIKDKCIGLIEGNHETSMTRYASRSVHQEVCTRLGTNDLTSESFVRLLRKRCSSTLMTTIFICHGHGGGRTAGSEPNHLDRLTNMFEADIYLRGHSHTSCILPPKITIDVNKVGRLVEKRRWAANWGTWRMSYPIGPSTYDSRALYAPRPLLPLEIVITDGQVNIGYLEIE